VSTRLKDLIGWHSLQESTTLFDASAFRATIRIFATLGLIYLASLIVSGEFLNSFSPNSHLAEIIFDTFKRPVITFGLSLPIIALIANHHRSIQSERQLKTTQDQNLFTNYVKHIEQFEEFLKDENVFKKLDDLNVSTKKLYRTIYSTALDGDLRPSLAFRHRLKMVRNKLTDLQVELSKMDRGKRQKSPEALKILDTAVSLSANHLCFDINEKESPLCNHSSFTPILLEISELCEEIEKCTSFIFPSNCSEDLQAIGDTVTRMAASMHRSLWD